MYQHHKESIENLKNYFADREEVIAVIFGGSVAKGCERPDSDLDAMVVITEEEYEIRQRGNRTAQTIEGHCTYEGGYFDIKYMTKQFLADAAERGSDSPRRRNNPKNKINAVRQCDVAALRFSHRRG